MYTRKQEQGSGETSLSGEDSAANSSQDRTLASSVVVSLRLRPSIKSALDSYTASQGVTRSETLARCVVAGLEALHRAQGARLDGGEGASQNLARQRLAFFAVSGPTTLGILRLLARWATEIGGLKTSEDDLLDEVWSVGAAEWAQLVEEAEPAGGDRSAGASPDLGRNGLPARKTNEPHAPPRRMPRSDVRFDPQWLARVEAFARSEGITRSRAIRELAGMGLDLVDEGDGIPMGRVDEVLEAIESEKRLMAPLGAATLGILRLLVHWATQTGGLRVSEDELLAEVRTAGEEEWQQLSEKACGLSSDLDDQGEG